jgi:hypothetical protein
MNLQHNNTYDKAGGSSSMQAQSRSKGSQMHHPINKTSHGITLSQQQKHSGISFKERSSSAMVLQGDHSGPKVLNNHPSQMINYEGYNNMNSQSNNIRHMKT